MSQLELKEPLHDRAMSEVAAALRALDPDGRRMARVFRATFDQLYDGQRTGRYKLDQLFKNEKTHFGTLAEINLQRELELDDGHVLDFSIAGHEVDCKYSHTGAWMLPIESFDQIVLVMQADDAKSAWSAGLVRVSEQNRRTSENRDRKTGLNAHGRSQILWLHKNASMQPNALLQLPPDVVVEIMGGRSGQSRVNELFRRATNLRLSRNIIATVAQQDDYMKRVRDNGGARSALRPEGYLILGGDYHAQRNLAAQFGAATPEPGELVSIRVAPTSATDGVEIDGGRWRLATPDDNLTVPAPVIPR
ncbi:NaeI family type II restriction endonuclease [Cellulosimicrobium sp. KWT-B]|uniref:NaeI family type II restriction endonuclease n=1 Tax=Cellulosimicrobium sp. KWT-B TaxID=1981152 RepID=UPI001E507636|nr:NaeI family type II restriction endonuclease [Cellulosimicrobium sp. KWT-B]